MTFLFVQAVMVLILGLWITVAVRDNVIHAEVNRDLVVQVLAMTPLKNEYPEIYASHAGRALTNARWQRGLFHLIVAAELTAAGLLLIGFGCLIAALFGGMGTDVARNVALLGSAAFTAVWGGLLIGGNYWCYWMCHESAQNTHFNLCLLGLGTMVLLSTPGL